MVRMLAFEVFGITLAIQPAKEPLDLPCRNYDLKITEGLQGTSGATVAPHLKSRWALSFFHDNNGTVPP